MEDLSASFSEQATCRICRAEATPEEPLFHPCRCSGSIRNVHQECLVEWLSHSQKKHCELCKTPFRFTKLYDAHMPENLPWGVFVRRAVWDTWSTFFSIMRTTMVALVWLIILPWIIRWAWRWMFWFADAGWAREEYLRRMGKPRTAGLSSANLTIPQATTKMQSWTKTFFNDLEDMRQHGNESTIQLAFGMIGNMLLSLSIETFANTTRFESETVKQSDHSIFSSVAYMSSLTPYGPLNRVILDIFEGQLITCTVILSFILIFLIREWVVQQQPLLNQDVAHNHEQILAQQREQNRQPAHNADDRYRAVAERIADLKADIEADIEQLVTLRDRVQAQRQGIEDSRRPGMPDRDVSSRATHIRRELEEGPSTDGAPDPADGENWTQSSTSPKAAEPIDPKPITNAGADARIFIPWWRGVDPVAVLPLADDDPAILTNEELSTRLDDPADNPTVHPPIEAEEGELDTDLLAPFLVRIPDEADHAQNGEAPAEDENIHAPVWEAEDLEPTDQLRLPAKRSLYDKLADWFWEGIEANPAADDQVIVIDERRLGLMANEAPFVPVNQNREHDHVHEDIDPEVAAAVQQAGLDPDLADGAEEMEGLLELLGIRGPIVGMIQTSLFCLLLVASTVLAAVVFPYVWGKMALSFVGSPVYFLVVLPLRIMSLLADFVVDTTLLLGGWIISVSAMATGASFAPLATLWPRIGALSAIAAKVSQAALAEAGASGQRLQVMLKRSDPYSFNESILGASVHAHVALKDMAGEANAIIDFAAYVLKQGAHTVSARDSEAIRDALKQAVAWSSTIPARAQDLVDWTTINTSNVFQALKAGSITLPSYSNQRSFDPALIYWDSFDRGIAIAAGYLALAALAAVYVASDVHITSSANGRKIETAVRDSLKQAGGVLKVILIISIEMLVFPFYCGLLLDLAFLPLFQSSSITSRLSFAVSKPYVFCFVHWFLGTYYMFHFALFVGMCRKILRKGVLWFIRDPDDPDFHPVRDVLERNVTKQLRKIAFSALVYGALVILCLGGVIWTISQIFRGIFPIVWRDTEPLLEFPLDLVLYTFLTPVVIAFVRPSEALQAAYAWWLRRCARALRLSHFLFGNRMQDEEGHYVFASWASRISIPVFKVDDGSVKTTRNHASEEGKEPAIKFIRNGRYVLTPSHDQYRHPKPGETFLAKTADGDVEVVDSDGKHHPHWSKVYLPPHFKARIMLFMVCLWIFSAFAGLCATLVPLSFGRRVMAFMIPDTVVNDIYAYSIGVYVLGGSLYLAIKGRAALQAMSPESPDASTKLRQFQTQAVRLAKCAYVYGYTFILQPLLMTALIELYIFIPLHTFLGLRRQEGVATISGADTQDTGVFEAICTQQWLYDLAAKDYTIVRHDVHLAQDLALAVLLINVFLRFIIARPTTRAAEAIRRATKDGLLDPDTWIVTRYFTLPSLIMSVFFLVVPMALSALTITFLRLLGVTMSLSFETLVYRFAYAAFEALLICANELFSWSAATLRWRARIRDEVYLVGERLHNFGEKKPPSGTRTILRRSRGAS